MIGGSRARVERGDRGALLPLVTILVTVLAFVMVSLASYATTGLMSAGSSRAIQAATGGARRGIDLALYQYAHDLWVPCSGLQALAVPLAFTDDLDVLSLNCTPAGVVDGHPVVTIASQARVGAATVTYLASIQVSVDGTGASLLRLERT